MSHSLVIAILKPDTKDIPRTVSQIMSPFNEELDVEPYQTDCYCVGRQAHNEADAELDKAMGTWDEARITFHNKYGKKSDEETDQLWKNEIYTPRMKYRDAILNLNPLKNSPDPNCKECGGTGKVMSTNNPRAKWDWYRIGGRWDGEMLGLPPLPDETGKGFNFEDKFESLERNSCLVKDVKTTPFAFVTFDETWVERGKMGWWGVVHNEKDKDDWNAQWERIKQMFPDYLAVSLDVHI